MKPTIDISKLNLEELTDPDQLRRDRHKDGPAKGEFWVPDMQEFLERTRRIEKLKKMRKVSVRYARGLGTRQEDMA